MTLWRLYAEVIFDDIFISIHMQWQMMCNIDVSILFHQIEGSKIHWNHWAGYKKKIAATAVNIKIQRCSCVTTLYIGNTESYLLKLEICCLMAKPEWCYIFHLPVAEQNPRGPQNILNIEISIGITGCGFSWQWQWHCQWQ